MTDTAPPDPRPNAFLGLPHPPTDAELAASLGRSHARWERLVSDLCAQCGTDTSEWNSWSRKAGWSLRLRRKGRAVVYLLPHRGSFSASFALGEAARAAALQGRLPAGVVQAIAGARKYAEGWAVRFEVRTKADASAVLRLAAAKIAH